MIKIRRHIPNTITCLNLFSGCLACIMAFEHNFVWAAIFIYIAAVFDFFDGFAARMLHAHSKLGKELDSLADCISFGFAPGAVMFAVLSLPEVLFTGIPSSISIYFPYIAFIIPVFSALRLAKFNIDERQATSFIGLPTPANSIFIASLACSLPAVFPKNGYLLILLVLIFSYLLVSKLPMFSLKIKNFSWKDNSLRFIFIGLSVLILLLLGIKYLYLVIVLYILMSIGIALFCKKTL